MAENKIINAIKFFKKNLKETGLKVSRVILFGSQAKGKATKESDVDIVIISDAFKGKDIFERAQLTKDAEIKTIKKFLIPLDILTMTPEEWKKNKAMLT